MTTPTYCRASFHYHDGIADAPVEVDVLDGRAATALRFEDCGFQLLDHASAVGDWSDHAEVDGVGGAEMAALAESFIGADVAIAFPAILRNEDEAATTPDYAPIQFVHSDFTDDYGPMVTEPDRPYRQFVEPLLRARGMTHADLASASRLMVLQFWRNTGPVDADYPLALCDARDIGPDRHLRERLPEYGGVPLEFELFGFRPPTDGEADHWYTFPRMDLDEVIALRTYDSRCVAEARPYWTPHSAFRDPHVAEGPEHARESVELRTLCIWQ